jgi:hypothetical protein
LEHMAFTTATVISSEFGNSPRMENLLASFDRQVRDHVNAMASTRQGSRNNGSIPYSDVNQVPPDEL